MIDRKKFLRVDELFDAALDRPPRERLRFIEEAAAGDEAVRAEVERLLELSAREDSLFPSGAMKGPIWEEVARELSGGEDAGIGPGARIGPYEVIGLLGRGGMGSVFRAKDPGLERDVAIKVLSRVFANDDPTLRRFEREARLLASLNHPNIAAIYDLLHVDDKRYLILELVEGETLAERLARGPLELPELLAVSEQLADALGEAHRKGVIHRDLKPSNVKLTREGRVKILDFGLAKSNEAEAHGEAIGTVTADAPTTQTGVVLGTPGYMSPEQARGTMVDKRTDVWAFGCLLYEMLTGSRAFAGQSPSDAIAAVLRDTVDWGRVPLKTPNELRWLIRRCLQQDPRDRLQDIGDARIEIAEIAGRDSKRGFAEPGSRSMGRWLVLASLAAFFAGMAFFRAVGDRGPYVSRGPTTRTTIVLGPEERLWIGASSSLALSPDGSRLAFVGEKDGRVQLFVRELDAYALTAVRGSDEARDPFFSPDGEWIGFFARGEMRKVALNRGIAETITEAGLQSRGAHWGDDGEIVYAQDGAPGLYTVAEEGGKSSLLSKLDERTEILEHLWPQWLPGGKNVLFTRRSSTESGVMDELAILERETGEVTILGPGAQGVYVPSGHIIYNRGDTLEAVAFEPAALRLKGSGVPIVEHVNAYPAGASTFVVSQSGSLVFLNRAPSAVLAVIDRDGTASPVEVAPGAPGWPRVAPNGRRAAIHIGGRDSREIWILDLERPGSIRQLTFQGGGFPTWSADGSRIAFMSRRGGSGDIYITAADGSSPPERLLRDGRTLIPVSWSSRGVLAYYEIGDITQRDIWVIDVARGGDAVPFVGTPANELSPIFSPDGRYLAYVSNETGQNEIYVRPYPPPGPVTAVSIDGGTEPVWSPDGSELYYRHASSLMAVPVHTESGFRVGRPVEVLSAPSLPSAGGNPAYDVFPEGDRFLVLGPAPGSTVDRLQVVLNLSQELQELVPIIPGAEGG